MGQAKVFLIIIAVLIAGSAYPLEENGADKESPLQSDLGLVGETQQKQNETDSSESTEPAYIEETYIEVLLPFIPRLNTSEIEAIINKTANDTDESDRLRRSADSDEVSKDTSSLEDVSPPSKGSTVPAILYASKNINSESARGEEKEDDSSSNESSEEKHNKGSENVHESSSSKESYEDKSKQTGNSTAAPSLYQLRNLNTRAAGDVGTKISSLYSEKSTKEKSSSEEDSSEEKNKPSSNSTGTPVLYTSSSSSSRRVRETVDKKDNGAAKKQNSCDTNQQSVGNKDIEGTKNQSSFNQQSHSITATQRPLYSAQNFYSRPGRQTLGKDNVQLSNGPSNDNSKSGLSSKNTKNPVLLSESNRQGQQSDLSNNEKLKSSSSSGNVSPALYSTSYSNVRKVREVVDSSENRSSNTRNSTGGTVIYVTPRNRALDGTKYVPASPASVRATSESR